MITVSRRIASALCVVALITMCTSMQLAAATTGTVVQGRRQILVNPDFSLPPVGDNPPGWFRAMMPDLTQGLNAGVSKDKVGSYVYLEQKGVTGMLFNNWAQRIENPPIGATMQLETEVSTENAADKGAIVLIMFFDEGGSIVGGDSSEGKVDLSGTKPWTKIDLEATVPPKSSLCIVRLGLSPGAGKLMARYARLYLSGGAPGSSPTELLRRVSQDWTAGSELLTNGDFEGPIILDSPVGWFRAMLPNLAIDHKAGGETLPGHGNVVFIEQKGVRASVVNNWAQRLEVIPVGARLYLQADVKTQNLPENTGFVMIQCWDTREGEEGKLLAAATSQSSQPIGDTEDWKTVSMEITVPEKTDAIIVRCGLSQSGKIWFDNVSLKIISPPPSERIAPSEPSQMGFQVTDEGMRHLERVRTLSEKLAGRAAEELGQNVAIRKEVFAQGEGKFQISLHFDFQNEEEPSKKTAP
jgi:hypothetical protein